MVFTYTIAKTYNSKDDQRNYQKADKDYSIYSYISFYSQITNVPLDSDKPWRLNLNSPIPLLLISCLEVLCILARAEKDSVDITGSGFCATFIIVQDSSHDQV